MHGSLCDTASARRDATSRVLATPADPRTRKDFLLDRALDCAGAQHRRRFQKSSRAFQIARTDAVVYYERRAPTAFPSQGPWQGEAFRNPFTGTPADTHHKYKNRPKIRLCARQEPAHRSGPTPSQSGLVYKTSAALLARMTHQLGHNLPLLVR
jgi:hypothetical protein